MTRQITLGFSPCPNDTFIFYPLVHELVDTRGNTFRERIEDVETLNQLALQGTLDMTKISFNAFGHVREEYRLLRAGSALGRGCGPLLVAKEKLDPADLRGKTVAVPGRFTTALLLLKLFNPLLEYFLVMPFHEIMDAVLRGDADAGLIIHESRFTYQGYGLHRLTDLGEWWEKTTGLPIPLGGIVARRSLGAEGIALIERTLKDGVAWSHANPAAAVHYIREHAQEMSDELCAAHIQLYVNDFSADLGNEGEKAIRCLLERGEQAGIIPVSSASLFD